jgi:hypothetical protein
MQFSDGRSLPCGGKVVLAKLRMVISQCEKSPTGYLSSLFPDLSALYSRWTREISGSSGGVVVKCRVVMDVDEAVER